MPVSAPTTSPRTQKILAYMAAEDVSLLEAVMELYGDPRERVIAYRKSWRFVVFGEEATASGRGYLLTDALREKLKAMEREEEMLERRALST